jgi:hypothetical protein
LSQTGSKEERQAGRLEGRGYFDGQVGKQSTRQARRMAGRQEERQADRRSDRLVGWQAVGYLTGK